MASPPDVILVLSPRMAKLVASILYPIDDDALDELGYGEFTSTEEAAQAVDALHDEIGEQLAREVATVTIVQDDLIVLPQDNDVARVAEKMAKAARGAVEQQAAEDDPRGEADR